MIYSLNDIKIQFNLNFKKMKKYLFTYFLGLLLLCLGMVGCSKEDNNGPSVKGYLNGTEIKEIKVTNGATVSFKFEIQSTANLSKVEVFIRKGIGLGTDSQLFLRKLAETGDLEGTTYKVEGSVVASTDLMISVGAIDADGNITTLQLNALLDVSEFDDLILMDALENGTSKTFLSTQYGLLLFAANTAADPGAIDLGFVYMESNSNVKACFVSFSDFSKAVAYPVIGANNITLLKKALAYTSTDAASVQQQFASGTDFPSVLGIDAGKSASNLKDGDVIAFKTQKGKYGQILVKTIDRKSEASTNQQTIKIKLVVQK